MPRGIVPRQPAKTGRQEGARAALRVKPAKAPSAPPLGKSKPTQKGKSASGKAPKSYNPTAPDRVAEILCRLETVIGGDVLHDNRLVPKRRRAARADVRTDLETVQSLHVFGRQTRARAI